MSPLLDTLGRMHPMVLHLPIGLLVGLAAYELVRAARRRRAPALGPAPVFFAWLGVVGSAAAIGTGLAHELELGSDDATTLHKWLSIAAGVAALFTAIAATVLAAVERRGPDPSQPTARRAPRATAAYRFLLFGTVAILVPAGHFGATITHGDGFLFGPLLRSAPAESVTPEGVAGRETGVGNLAGIPGADPAILAVRAGEILASRCESCHGTARARGRLRLDSVDAILAGGSDGPAVIPGDPEASLMIQRMRRPLDARGHMPPRAQPQPAEDEIAALEAWILHWPETQPADSHSGTGVGGVPPAAGERGEPGTTEPSGGAQPSEVPAAIPLPGGLPEPPPPAPAALAALRAGHIQVRPVAAGSSLLSIDFSSVPAAEDETVTQLLLPLRENIADLSLAGTSITGSTLALAADMPWLARLDLSGTAITDAGLESLANHGRLHTLILTGTAVTDGAAPLLASMPELRRVGLSSTLVTDDALNWLALVRPDLQVDFGDDGSEPLEAEPEPATPAPP
jgi:mono/diheme cytochrome c family protein